MSEYQESAREFEPRWQRHWAEHATHRTPNPGDVDFDGDRDKYVVLDFFPYPSGIGLHIGHPLGYIATDVVARFWRMNGRNVLHAMGFDSFGLPAEQYAIQTGQHPRVTTDANIANMSDQLQLLGLGHDQTRTFSTSDSSYYRWTQWLFLVLFESYYDPEDRWKGPDSRPVHGRARPIGELVDRLRNGEWLVDTDGVPAPASLLPDGRQATETDIQSHVDLARLAYISEMPVNWCPMLGTVLSNEEVTNDGRSERGNYPVYRRPLRQWVLRITQYAERLLDDLDGLDWPPGIVQMQRDWIGRSEGAEVDLPVVEDGDASSDGLTVRVFTTRPDTLFGASFAVLSPEHPLVESITTDAQRDAVTAYRRETSEIRSARRGEEVDTKSGVFTGGYVQNPATGERIPVWVASYVLMEYGTGAIMAVPAHDERDMVFAQTHGLRIRPVVVPPDTWLLAQRGEMPGDVIDLRAAYLADPASFPAVFAGEGVGVHSSNDDVQLDGLPTARAKQEIAAWLESGGAGKRRVQYRLRDWLFSRQRYWGEPFPVLHDPETGRVYALDERELPALLPELPDFQPDTGQAPDSDPAPPLTRAREWVSVEGYVTAEGRVRVLRAGEEPTSTPRRFVRDVNTMPNWAGSCWYYLRYFDPANEQAFVGPEAERYWSGGGSSGSVDLYVGGAEHAVLHLLYARFWHKVLYDRGLVSTAEPFQRLFNQGMITADAYHDERGVYVDFHDVEVRSEGKERVAYERGSGRRLSIQTGKMGKRYKNGIPPEEVCAQYTVDTLRAYEMYLGPLESSKPWQPDDIIGVFRFLRNVWRLGTDRDRWPLSETGDDATEQLAHRTIQRVTDDIQRLRMNTALAAIIEFTNALQRRPTVTLQQLRTLVLLVSPFAPHLGEELAARLFPDEHAKHGSAIRFSWPRFDPSMLKADEVVVPVQVNGKKRGAVTVPIGVDEATLLDAARREPNVARMLEGRTLVRTVAVMKPAPKIVSFVVR